MHAGRDLAGEIDDIVADGLARLEQLRERHFSGGDREFRSYLYRVVVSACVEALRRRRWTTALDAPVTLPDGDVKPLKDVLGELVDPQLAASELVEEDEQRAVLAQALDRIDPRCRGLLVDFHLKDVPVRELAHREAARANTIEVALTRCRARLYQAYLEAWVAGSDDERRERIDKAVARLSGPLGDVFRAWWSDHRTVAQISEAEGLDREATRRLLSRAKTEVWRLVGEGVSA